MREGPRHRSTIALTFDHEINHDFVIQYLLYMAVFNLEKQTHTRLMPMNKSYLRCSHNVVATKIVQRPNLLFGSLLAFVA